MHSIVAELKRYVALLKICQKSNLKMISISNFAIMNYYKLKHNSHHSSTVREFGHDFTVLNKTFLSEHLLLHTNMILHQFFLLICIMCCAVTIHGTEFKFSLGQNDVNKCFFLCGQCNASVIFAVGECVCYFINNSDKDSNEKCMQRVQSQVQAMKQRNMLYDDDMTDEERNARSISRYNRRLKQGDAEKVAQYFINEGPAAGHSHFVRAFNAAYDNQPSTSSFSGIDESNPKNEFRSVLLTSPSTSSNTYDSPLHMVPEYGPRASKIIQNKWLYNPTSSGIIYPTHEEYDPSVMKSIIRPNKLPFYHITFTPVTIPDYGIHQMLHPYVYHSDYQRGLVRSSDPLSDKSNIIVGQSCENNDDSSNDDSKLSTARNAHKEVELVLNQSQYPLFSQTLYKLNPYYPYPYPLIYNPYNYYYPSIPRHAQHYSDPQTSATNLQSLYENNANTERSAISTTDKPLYFNDGTEKFVDAINNIPKEENIS